MDEKAKQTEEYCEGQCRHSKSYHNVKIKGEDALACCKMDCLCMKYVEQKKPAEA